MMSRKSRTNRQYNDQSRQEKRTNNFQTTTQQTTADYRELWVSWRGLEENDEATVFVQWIDSDH
jgi:hypothetical protein